MITIFYKSHDSIVSEVDEEILKQIDYEDLLWVDLMDATEHENGRVEEFFGVNIQTRQIRLEQNPGYRCFKDYVAITD